MIRFPSRTSAIVLVLGLFACASPSSGGKGGAHADNGGAGASLRAGRETPAVDPNAEAAKGVTDPRLRDLLFRHWETYVRREPVAATYFGDHRFDDKLPDRSQAAIEKAREEDRQFLFEARAIRADDLPKPDQTTLALFLEQIEAHIESEVCEFDEWVISANANPTNELNELAELHRTKTMEDAKNLIARYKSAGAFVDQIVANLKRGAEKGEFANAESTKRAISMTEKQLKTPIDKWAVLEPANKSHEGWSDADAKSFKHDLVAVAESEVKPALERWLAFVKKEIVPKARPDDRVGLAALPFGKACYKARIRAHTTLPLTPEELHQKGREEIDRINKEMQALGMKLFGMDDLFKILEKLRSDKSLYFKTDKEIEETAQHALDAAHAKIKDYFGILPKTDCVVARIPDYEAPFTTIAYYRQPASDGSRPGRYFINVYEPTTRPKYEAEALAFHESIPGHHLQIAIAEELTDIPSFRKHTNMTAFVEGWGLYAERLSEEMGLYSSDLDRMGMLSYDAWRASRLVVDTGLHAMGWSREAAKGFMLGHTGLAPNNIDNEVDRYIGNPGQALAYKTGQLELWRLRHEAEKTMGSAFDVKAFHDAVLGHGAVSLPVLRAQVEAWMHRSR
jgi:uncharacterized protein (DUF885 family)